MEGEGVTLEQQPRGQDIYPDNSEEINFAAPMRGSFFRIAESDRVLVA